MGSTSREAMRVRGASKLKNSPARAPERTPNRQSAVHFWAVRIVAGARRVGHFETSETCRPQDASLCPPNHYRACLHEHFDAFEPQEHAPRGTPCVLKT